MNRFIFSATAIALIGFAANADDDQDRPVHQLQKIEELRQDIEDDSKALEPPQKENETEVKKPE